MARDQTLKRNKRRMREHDKGGNLLKREQNNKTDKTESVMKDEQERLRGENNRHFVETARVCWGLCLLI